MLPTCGEGFLKTFNKISRNLKITIKYATQFKKYTTQYSILFLNNLFTKEMYTSLHYFNSEIL